MEENGRDVSRRRKLFGKVVDVCVRLAKRADLVGGLIGGSLSGKRRISRSSASLSRDSPSQIHTNICHTPHKCTFAKSTNDLSNFATNLSTFKKTEKLNIVLDFVATHFLDKANHSLLSRSINDLIVESCVEIVLENLRKIAANMVQQKNVKNSNFINIICSTETSSSDSELKNLRKNVEGFAKTPSNSGQAYNKENQYSNNQIHTEKSIKPKFNMKNIMSPTFQESSAFKYKFKNSKTLPKLPQKSSKKVPIPGKPICSEYSHFISAKKSVVPPQSTIKYHLTSSTESVKSLVGSNTDRKNEPSNNEETSKKNTTSKKNKDFSSMSRNSPILNTNNNKTKNESVYKKTFHKDHAKERKINEKTSRNAPKNETKLQFSKTYSVNCNESEPLVHPNMKVLNVKCEKKENLKITPITFIFAGGNTSLNTSSNISKKNCPIKSQIKSVVSNLKYFPEDVSKSDEYYKKNEFSTVKSKTTFVRDSVFNNDEKRKMQVSNYCVVNLQSSETPGLNSFCETKCWSRFYESSLDHHLVGDLSKAAQFSNFSISTMMNNNNDKQEQDSSDTHNTDSSCTFHSVKAKYFKQHCSVTYNSENDQMTSSRDVQSKNTDLIMSENDVGKVSIGGDTFSCNDKPSLMIGETCLGNSQTFFSQYIPMSSDDDTDAVKESTRIGKGGAKMAFVTATVIDICPKDEQGELQYKAIPPEQEKKVEEQDHGFNMIYLRSGDDKKLKRNQKNISDNLLKHTFASQQKIRLKYE